MSRSTWARELKSCCGILHNYLVPSRSTWACELKCYKQAMKAQLKRVTLHVSVWVEMESRRLLQLTKLQVTLHVSVWVEMYYRRQRFWRSVGHAPRKRVSWNFINFSKWNTTYVTLHVSVWVEIWIACQFHKVIMSRSTWACELKCYVSSPQ